MVDLDKIDIEKYRDVIDAYKRKRHLMSAGVIALILLYLPLASLISTRIEPRILGWPFYAFYSIVLVPLITLVYFLFLGYYGVKMDREMAEKMGGEVR